MDSEHIENIKVSIVTPAFNNEKSIGQTISSVLKQTHVNWEMIIVDDASSDKTVEVASAFSDERIMIFSNETNCGAAYSRNKALGFCRGEYIAFLDADDLWDSNKIELQLKFMLNGGYRFSCTYYRIENVDGSIAKYVTSPKRINHQKFMRTDCIGCLTVMYRRDPNKLLQIPNTIRKRNDYAMWLLLSESQDCYCLPMVLATYRKSSNSISSGKKIYLLKYHKEMFEILFGFNSFVSSFCAVRNAFYYLLKKIFRERKITRLKNER